MSKSVGANSFYFHYDGSGNVVGLTDSSQNSVAEYSYDSYGNALTATGTQAANNAYRYSTKELHSWSGLYSYGFRFYSPSLGRWINRDPIAESGGLNVYHFVGNNPVNSIDANGLFGAKFGSLNLSIGDTTWDFSGTNWHDIECGWYAGADGLNPFGDPYKDMGYYDPNSYNAQWSHGLGTISQQALLTAATSPQAIAGAGRAIGSGLSKVGFAEKLFQSKIFGVASAKFGNSGAGAQGAWNVPGRMLKAGWSSTEKYGGGMVFRIGRGIDAVNPNVAASHYWFQSTFVRNVVANPIMQALRNAR